MHTVCIIAAHSTLLKQLYNSLIPPKFRAYHFPIAVHSTETLYLHHPQDQEKSQERNLQEKLSLTISEV